MPVNYTDVERSKIIAEVDAKRASGLTLAQAIEGAPVSTATYHTWKYRAAKVKRDEKKKAVVQKQEPTLLTMEVDEPKASVGRLVALIGSSADVGHAIQSFFR